MNGELPENSQALLPGKQVGWLLISFFLSVPHDPISNLISRSAAQNFQPPPPKILVYPSPYSLYYPTHNFSFQSLRTHRQITYNNTPTGISSDFSKESLKSRTAKKKEKGLRKKINMIDKPISKLTKKQLRFPNLWNQKWKGKYNNSMLRKYRES